jgi:signal transduction histidine kinase
MSEKAIYIVAPEGALRDRCATLLPSARVLGPGLDLDVLDSAPPGVVLVEPGGVGAGELMRAAKAMRAEEGWRICTVEEREGESVEVRTVSLGAGHTAQDVLRFAGEGSGVGQLLELHGVLAEIARARHDLNNPLTSALAEVQILLMDAAGGPEEESLLTIQEQLRRLRDRLVATRHLRPASARP